MKKKNSTRHTIYLTTCGGCISLVSTTDSYILRLSIIKIPEYFICYEIFLVIGKYIMLKNSIGGAK